jgi:hypothetical protein
MHVAVRTRVCVASSSAVGAPADQSAAAPRYRVLALPDEADGRRDPPLRGGARVRHLYGLTLLTIRLLGAALDAYARRENLYTTGAADDDLIADRRTLLPVLIAYAVVILVGLALPTVANVLYLAVAVLLVVPFPEIRRMFSRQSN